MGAQSETAWLCKTPVGRPAPIVVEYVAVRDCLVLIGTSQLDWRQYPVYSIQYPAPIS